MILSYDAIVEEDFWLVDDYFPEIAALDNDNREYTSQAIARVLDVQRVEPVLVPADCVDGFAGVLLEPARRPTSIPTCRPASPASRGSIPRCATRGTEQLRADLASGAWDARHGHLRALTELDVGYRLIVEEANEARKATEAGTLFANEAHDPHADAARRLISFVDDLAVNTSPPSGTWRVSRRGPSDSSIDTSRR